MDNTDHKTLLQESVVVEKRISVIKKVYTVASIMIVNCTVYNKYLKILLLILLWHFKFVIANCSYAASLIAVKKND